MVEAIKVPFAAMASETTLQSGFTMGRIEWDRWGGEGYVATARSSWVSVSAARLRVVRPGAVFAMHRPEGSTAFPKSRCPSSAAGLLRGPGTCVSSRGLGQGRSGCF